MEQALLLGAAVVVAGSALPYFFHGLGGYLDGFSENENISTSTGSLEHHTD